MESLFNTTDRHTARTEIIDNSTNDSVSTKDNNEAILDSVSIMREYSSQVMTTAYPYK